MRDDPLVIIDTVSTSGGRHITEFDSDFQLSPLLAQTPATVAINVVHIKAGGTVGRLPAVVPQAFCVVTGEGWVSGTDDERVPIALGQIAYWTRDEHHAAGSVGG